MFSTCNATCVGTVVISKTDQCEVYQRNEVPVRLILGLCDFDFPTGAYDASALATAFEAAITAGQIGVTPELADLQWADPTTTTKQYKGICRPATTIKVSRQLTGMDFNATDVDSAGALSPYEDRLFFKNIVKNKAVAIRGYVTCDGKVYLFLNPNGTFMQYSVDFWTGFNTDVDGQRIEFKNYAVTFMGDPVDWTTPYLDIVAAGATSTLGWIFS